jgi:hypothetical protein
MDFADVYLPTGCGKSRDLSLRAPPRLRRARPGERSDPGPPQPGRAKQSGVSDEKNEIASLPSVARNDIYLVFLHPAEYILVMVSSFREIRFIGEIRVSVFSRLSLSTLRDIQL